MNLNSIAWLDAVGMKSSTPEKFEELWNAADMWTNGDDSSLQVLFDDTYRSVQAHVTAISDAFLMKATPDPDVDNYFTLTSRLKRALETIVNTVYANISRGDYIDFNNNPVLGGRKLDSVKGIPVFSQVIGSGRAWIDLFNANIIIEKHKEWQSKYSYYCVGEKSRPRSMQTGDSISEEIRGRKLEIIALVE